MKKIAFIIDSSSGIKNGEFPDVYVLPLAITLKDDTDKSKISILRDGIECDEVKICELIKDNKDICTSQASIGELTKIVESIYDKYDRIYAIPIPAKLSQSFNTWRLLAEDYPKILPISQADLTIGFRWSIEDLIEMKNKGTLDDNSIQEYFKQKENKRCGLLIVHDVKQLKKGGRVSNFKSIIINAIGLKICITLNKDGLCYYSNALTFNKAVDVLLKVCQEKIENFDITNIKRVAILTSPTKEHEEDVRKVIENYFLKEKLNGVDFKLYWGFLPGVICAHTGPFCFAFYIECK